MAAMLDDKIVAKTKDSLKLIQYSYVTAIKLSIVTSLTPIKIDSKVWRGFPVSRNDTDEYSTKWLCQPVHSDTIAIFVSFEIPYLKRIEKVNVM